MRCIIIRKNRVLLVFNVIIALTVAVSLGITVIAVGINDSDSTVPITSVSTEKESVALTVNVYEYTDVEAYLEIFKKAKATFFVSEEFQETCPEKVKLIIEKGHSIGILENDVNISKNELYDRLATRIERMARLTDRNIDFIRIDEEDCDEAIIKNIYAIGLLPVQWSEDDDDFSRGDVVLITDIKTAEEAIKKSAADGIETVTVDELIGGYFDYQQAIRF